VYNVGSRAEWELDIKQISDIILDYISKDDSFVTYENAEPFTTGVKKMDFSKAVKDLNHNPIVSPEEGIARTIDWMRWYYRLNNKEKIIERIE